MGFVPQPLVAAVVAALATVASLSCADSRAPTDPYFSPEVRPPNAARDGGPIRTPEARSDVVHVPPRFTEEARNTASNRKVEPPRRRDG